jgi:hypothetical protein
MKILEIATNVTKIMTILIFISAIIQLMCLLVTSQRSIDNVESVKTDSQYIVKFRINEGGVAPALTLLSCLFLISITQISQIIYELFTNKNVESDNKVETIENEEISENLLSKI